PPICSQRLSIIIGCCLVSYGLLLTPLPRAPLPRPILLQRATPPSAPPLLLCLPPLPSSSSITVAIAPSSSSISRTHLVVASVTAATHVASSWTFSFAATVVFDRPSYNSRLLPLLLVPSSPTFIVATPLPLLLLYKLLPPLRLPSLSHLLLPPASPSSSPAAVVAPKCHRDCCPSLLHIATAALSFACSKNYSCSPRRL
ncbi:hypothetical protein GW17_00056123, partial [Ensete ventricosum]